MGYLFSYKVQTTIKDYYSSPCFFMALYCLYRNAYFGQSFQLSGKYVQNKKLKRKNRRFTIRYKKSYIFQNLGNIWT